MKKIKLINLAVLTLAVLTFGSCKKEGCTDVDATNYNASAKKDDNSCNYEGSVVLWYGPEASQYFLNDDAVTLTFYVDNKIVGSSAASVYWTGKPSCGDNGSITITKDLSNTKSMSYTYSIIDQTGFEYWSGVLNFTANTCLAVELN